MAILLRYKVHHLAFWTFLFLGWFYFRADDFDDTRTALLITLTKVAMLAALTYISAYVLLPRLLYRKKYAWFALAYLSLISAGGLLKLAIIIELMYPGLPLFMNFKNRVYDNIIPLFLLVTTGTAARLIKDYFAAQRQMIEIARERAETELKFLRSQVNPHFLFNSLNSIYFLIDKQNVEARKTLLQFSDLLRYQLYDCSAEQISIEKEIAFLHDYTKLQQIRKDANYQVQFIISEDVKNLSIAPLILIPFVENAFKHISHHSDVINYVRIDLFLEKDELNFRVVNSTDGSSSGSKDGTGGIGLANVSRRLNLLYPGRHRLDIDKQDKEFSVHLQLSTGQKNISQPANEFIIAGRFPSLSADTRNPKPETVPHTPHPTPHTSL